MYSWEPHNRPIRSCPVVSQPKVLPYVAGRTLPQSCCSHIHHNRQCVGKQIVSARFTCHMLKLCWAYILSQMLFASKEPSNWFPVLIIQSGIWAIHKRSRTKHRNYLRSRCLPYYSNFASILYSLCLYSLFPPFSETLFHLNSLSSLKTLFSLYFLFSWNLHDYTQLYIIMHDRPWPNIIHDHTWLWTYIRTIYHM